MNGAQKGQADGERGRWRTRCARWRPAGTTPTRTLLRVAGRGPGVDAAVARAARGRPTRSTATWRSDGHGYAPCVTSTQELAASGWNRSHEVVSGPGHRRRAVPRALRPVAQPARARRRGRRAVAGPAPDSHRPGPAARRPAADRRTDAAAPSSSTPLLGQGAHATPVVRALRGAWVSPALGEPYLAIGVDLYDNGPQSVEAVRLMMQQAVAGAPAGMAVSTVAMADEYDPVGHVDAHLRPAVLRPRRARRHPADAGPAAWGAWPPATAPTPTGYGPPRPPAGDLAAADAADAGPAPQRCAAHRRPGGRRGQPDRAASSRPSGGLPRSSRARVEALQGEAGAPLARGRGRAAAGSPACPRCSGRRRRRTCRGGPRRRRRRGRGGRRARTARWPRPRPSRRCAGRSRRSAG